MEKHESDKMLVQIMTTVAIIQTEISHIKEVKNDVSDLKGEVKKMNEQTRKEIDAAESIAQQALIKANNNDARLTKIEANFNKAFWIIATPLLLGLLALILK